MPKKITIRPPEDKYPDDLEGYILEWIERTMDMIDRVRRLEGDMSPMSCLRATRGQLSLLRKGMAKRGSEAAKQNMKDAEGTLYW